MIKYSNVVRMYHQHDYSVKAILVEGETKCYFVTDSGRKFIKTSVYSTRNQAKIAMHENRMALLKKRLEIPESQRFTGAKYITNFIWTDRDLLQAIQNHRQKMDELVAEKYK